MSDPRAYYNDSDPDAAHVLRWLADENLIMPGDIDDRSIKDVQPDDLKGYTQVHAFAGGGLWSLAARLAGWPDERPFWSGSCPCQPFSGAGKGLGTHDPRHLWPDFFRLISGASEAGHGPPVLLGEQVGGSAGQDWFDGVAADLASIGFESRSRDIPACAVDSPQIRSRLFWCAVEHGASRGREQGISRPQTARHGREPATANCGGNGDVEHSTSDGWREGRPEHEIHGGRPAITGSDVRNLADCCCCSGLEIGSVATNERSTLRQQGTSSLPDDVGGGGRDPGRDVADGTGFTSSPRYAGTVRQRFDPVEFERCDSRRSNGSAWAGSEWIVCHDGKARRTESGLRLLVNGMAGRIPAWRLAGNSISPILAAEVIGAFLEAERDGALLQPAARFAHLLD